MNNDVPCHLFSLINITISRLCNIKRHFNGRKNGNFQMKNCVIFLMFAKNIDRGNTLMRRS